MGDKVREKWVIFLGSKRKSWTDAIKPEPPLYATNAINVSARNDFDLSSFDCLVQWIMIAIKMKDEQTMPITVWVTSAVDML